MFPNVRLFIQKLTNTGTEENITFSATLLAPAKLQNHAMIKSTNLVFCFASYYFGEVIKDICVSIIIETTDLCVWASWQSFLRYVAVLTKKIRLGVTEKVDLLETQTNK